MMNWKRRFLNLETFLGVAKLLIFPGAGLYLHMLYLPLTASPDPNSTAFVRGIEVLMWCFSLYFGIEGITGVAIDHRKREARNKILRDEIIQAEQPMSPIT